MTDALLPFGSLLLAGIVAGALNVIAGGGSFLTLPILIFLGLPAVVANGTNRVGILMQNIGAVWSFQRYRLLDWASIRWAALPASAGSLLGVWLAFSVEEMTFRRLLAFLMVALTLWTLWDPIKAKVGTAQPSQHSRTVLAIGFFLVGIYGGFVQAGVGFLILALTTYMGLDLVRGNAVKVLTILVFTLLSLGIFAWQGQIAWWHGLTLGIGTTIGGQIGVRLTILKGHKWVKTVVTLAIVFFAVKLWISG